MKKNYIMGVIACAALTMTSCSNDEIGGNNTKQGDPIEFGVYLGRDAQGSRGTIITTENLTKFGVSAYYNNDDFPEFMYNQAVIKEGTAWTYSPVKYWPTMSYDHLRFFAYSPYSDDSNGLTKLSKNTEKGLPYVEVSLPEDGDLTKMVDFVAASPAMTAKIDVVKLEFKHEMTRISLQAKVSEDVFDAVGAANKTKVVIRSIKLNNGGEFYTKAKYKFHQGIIDSDWIGHVKAKSPIDIQSILNWSSDTWTISNKNVIDANSNKGIALEGQNPVNLLKKTGSKQEYLFLIPSENVDAKGKLVGLEANSTSATITYDIITEDSNLEDGYSKTSATKTVYLPAGIMQQGKAYNLTFTIAVDQVKLDATVADWDTATNSGIDVPYTPDDATPNP